MAYTRRKILMFDVLGTKEENKRIHYLMELKWEIIDVSLWYRHMFDIYVWIHSLLFFPSLLLFWEFLFIAPWYFCTHPITLSLFLLSPRPQSYTTFLAFSVYSCSFIRASFFFYLMVRKAAAHCYHFLRSLTFYSLFLYVPLQT